MIRLGLLGHPLSHSLSPKLHTAALKACDLQGDYSLYPVNPGDIKLLRTYLDKIRIGDLTGLNVTIPHKQNVIQFLDELTPGARAIGAVNTISPQAAPGTALIPTPSCRMESDLESNEGSMIG